MDLIIAGTRTFTDYDRLCTEVNKLLEQPTRILSGGAQGADALGERYAQEHGLGLWRFPADWSKHGRAAGPLRNALMVEHADALLAFWDGVSRGTKDVITKAHRKDMPVFIVHI